MLLAVVSLFGAGIALAGPAQAYCDYDHACFYSNSNFEGWKRRDYNSQLNWRNLAYDNNGNAPLYYTDGYPSNVSSIENEDPDTKLSVYYNSGNLGPCFMVAANGSVSNMGGIYIKSGMTANDNMNSHKFSNSCLGNTYNF
ncbi:hypothetical protein [Streptomyces sp. NPDC048269]|uniref:hypothetical protein n=1 Tax=Streptomyces sp. NPDC048269 TaxID=3155753 RepID=UPI003427A582